MKHGYTPKGHTPPEYYAWQQMKQRCHNPRSQNFKHYGARGIVVWPGWRHDFVAFIGHIGWRPSNKHSLDRIDNDGNYEPGNVRWALPATQHNNKRTNRLVEVDGTSYTQTQLARKAGISKQLLRQRLKKGWPIKAVLAPPHEAAA